MTQVTVGEAVAWVVPPQARPEITDDQRVEIKEAFDLFDSEKTGKLDYHELKVRKFPLVMLTASVTLCFEQVAMRALGFPVRKAEVRQLMRDVDAETTGRVGYADFLTISACASWLPSHAVRTFFPA